MQLIAIDGPGGSGKSTVSRALALRLGLPRLDTGAMYRAVALAALRAHVAPSDRASLGELARKMDLCVGERVVLEGEDVSNEIRSVEIDATVSEVASAPEVRSELVERQRAWASSHGGGVVEGRDIGSVVFPDAPLKIYLTASPSERAERRAKERVTGGSTLSATAEGLARRDELDSTRDLSPLIVPVGAHVIDSTGRSVEAIVDEVLALWSPHP